MVALPEPIPKRIKNLPRDDRGFPVPWFVQWIDGKPDFRVIDSAKLWVALHQPRCWVCGEPMGKHRVFCLGPMCCVNRVISEPPSHRECAEWSVQACPFLSRPRMRRNEKDLPEDGKPAAGIHLDRNPGVVCLWETKTYAPFKPSVGESGYLFRVGDPVRADWWTEGRKATRMEVMTAMLAGLPALAEMINPSDRDEITELQQAIALARVVPLLPAAMPQGEVV